MEGLIFILGITVLTLKFVIVLLSPNVQTLPALSRAMREQPSAKIKWAYMLTWLQILMLLGMAVYFGKTYFQAA